MSTRRGQPCRMGFERRRACLRGLVWPVVGATHPAEANGSREKKYDYWMSCTAPTTLHTCTTTQRLGRGGGGGGGGGGGEEGRGGGAGGESIAES